MNAPVIAVKAKNRRLDPPRNPQIVGWWSEGAAPGDHIGSAVIVGHTVSTGGGVFDDVDRLKQGATVEVAGSSNRWAYRVDSVEVLSKGEFARQAERIFNQSVAGRLVLITCEDWDGEVYRSNVVAIARPV